MRLKQLRGLPVIDPTAAHKIGTVVDYQVDPVAGRLAALDITCIDNGESERILTQRIRRVGSNAVILTARGGSMPGTVPEINEHWLDTSSLSGLEVIGDDGNRIGHLVDATFDQDSLDMDAYVLRASFFGRLIGRRGRIQPGKVHSSSRELMVVTTGRVKELAVESEPAARLDLRMPLKDPDRLPDADYEPVGDGPAVGVRTG
jgi:sporulation protein YlmC with PRC-barrel domain